MFFSKKRKKDVKRTTLIIEEMVTDNNGLPVLNFGDDVVAIKEAHLKQLQDKKSTKKPNSSYKKHFFDDKN